MVLVIVGKTCSGKDTVARYIEEKYKFKRIITHTTRPMRPDDVQGVSHHFVMESGLKEFDPNEMVLKTDIGGYMYFALKSQFLGADSVCILDPQGVEDLRQAGIECHTMYVDLDEEFIIRRALARGTSMSVIDHRLNAERERFDSFRDNRCYDFYINNSHSENVLKAAVDTCMQSLVG